MQTTQVAATPDIDAMVQRASAAAAVFTQYTQAATDRIVRAVYEAAFANRIPLAKLACEETGRGRWQDKVVKNALASHFAYEDIRRLRTVGVIHEDALSGITEIAQPRGPIFATIPIVAPTSTAIFQILIALKTRNPLIICASAKAERCTTETARLCYEAALQADAPEDCVQWITDDEEHSVSRTCMDQKALALILLSGAFELVEMAQSAQAPAMAVSPGNVPVYVESSADVPFAAEQIITSKLFDYGMSFASEQAIVVERCVAEELAASFRRHGGHILLPDEVTRLERLVRDATGRRMDPAYVGQPALRIAQQAGLDLAEHIRLLIAPLGGVGLDWPLSVPLLAPLAAWYIADDFQHAVNLCLDLNEVGGMPHTASIFSNNDARIKAFAGLMNAGRVLVNTPASQGTLGGLYNTLHPSALLGGGTGCRGITTENISAAHLLNIQRIVRRRENPRLAQCDLCQFWNESIDTAALVAAYNRNY